jgi:UDP-N-acetylmuramate--alanine ligase
LESADALFLLPIYPARELPIPGITSEWLLSLMHPHEDYKVVERQDLKQQISKQIGRWVSEGESVVVMTLGAGDIDRLVNEIKQNLNML